MDPYEDDWDDLDADFDDAAGIEYERPSPPVIPRVLFNGTPLEIGTADRLSALDDPDDLEEAWDLEARRRDDGFPAPTAAAECSQPTIGLRKAVWTGPDDGSPLRLARTVRLADDDGGIIVIDLRRSVTSWKHTTKARGQYARHFRN